MSKIFTRTFRVRYSDINSYGQLTPADLARYIIDTAYDWGETLGLGYRASEELGLYWVIRETEIQFLEPLHFLDEFDFTIWMLEWKRVRGIRAFVVKHKSNGLFVARGTQQIASMDVQTQRPVSPPQDLIDNFRLDEPPDMPFQRFPKLLNPPDQPFTFQIKVAWQDLDILEMVNNAVYIGYAEEALTQLLSSFGWSPAELKAHRLTRLIRRMHIQYHMPAVWGDTLDASIFSLKLDHMGGSVIVVMRRASDGASIASCVLDWSLCNQGDGTGSRLPESLLKPLRSTLLPESS